MRRTAYFLVLQFAECDRELWSLAVLLFDTQSDKLHIRCRDNLTEIARADAEVLGLLLCQLCAEADTTSGELLLRRLEDTLSNVVRISDRVAVQIDTVPAALDELADMYLR